MFAAGAKLAFRSAGGVQDARRLQNQTLHRHSCGLRLGIPCQAGPSTLAYNVEQGRQRNFFRVRRNVCASEHTQTKRASQAMEHHALVFAFLARRTSARRDTDVGQRARSGPQTCDSCLRACVYLRARMLASSFEHECI